jgi:hypothetical protein
MRASSTLVCDLESKSVVNDCEPQRARSEFKGIDGAGGMGNGRLLHHGYLADKKGQSHRRPLNQP